MPELGFPNGLTERFSGSPRSSLTSMYNCTHGPKKDCAQCLVPEMAKAIEEAVGYLPADNPAMHQFWREWLPKARAVLEKAKQAQG